MARAVMAGPRDKLPSVIATLHEMKLIHIIDHHGEDETFRIGKPLPPAADLSENLVKLRSIANLLAVKTPPKKKETVRIEELRGKILTLELNITEEDAARKKAEALLSDLDRRIDELRPFAALELALETYRGYGTIAVLVGHIVKEVSEADFEGVPTEVFQAPGFVAVFAPKSAADQVLGVLAKFGFTQIDIPTGEGNPEALLDEALADLEKWKARLEEIEGRLETLRERYAAFVIAAEEVLEVEVDKAEAPLRFAVSDHSFVIDGWLPSARSSELRERFDAMGIFVESFGIPFHPPPAHVEELSFETFGISIPLQPIIHKAFGVADMVYLSILFAAMHLGTAYIIGFVNEIRHNKKHALAKLGWFLCLFGLFTLLTFSLRWNGIALWVWNVPLGWFPRTIEPLGLSGFVGVKLPLVSLVLIFGAFLALTESVIAPIEIAGLLANIMSYTRLAGLGIGKAAIASAFNTILFRGMIFPGQIGFVILGIVFLIMAHLLVFLLGWISAGIQALRLNYVEAFIKFYKGNGTPFRPFGMRTTQEV